jgi:hypothetical protein
MLIKAKIHPEIGLKSYLGFAIIVQAGDIMFKLYYEKKIILKKKLPFSC